MLLVDIFHVYAHNSLTLYIEEKFGQLIVTKYYA